MVSYFNRPPRPGSTDETAQKLLRMLEREEQEKLERARLEAANWQPPASSATPFSDGRIFGDGRDAVADRVQAELDRRDALRDAARRRVALGRPSDQSFAHMPGAAYSGQLAEANEQNARPSSGPGVGRTPQQPPTTPSMLPPNQQQFEPWLRDDPSLLDQGNSTREAAGAWAAAPAPRKFERAREQTACQPRGSDIIARCGQAARAAVL